MSHNMYNTHNRYKNRNRIQFRRSLLIFLSFVALFCVGIWFGKSRSESEQSFLSAQLAEKTNEIGLLQDDLMRARATAQTAETRYTQLQNDVLKELPFDGPLRTLIEELRQRLDEGVDPERLSFSIKATRPPQNCTDPAVKRFVIATPAYKGPESRAEIESALFVSGHGRSAKNTSGAPEAWYNPAQPVQIVFETKDGTRQTKKGALPFSDTMIVKDKEYRFTLSEGARSFVKVTYDRCDYP